MVTRFLALAALTLLKRAPDSGLMSLSPWRI